MLSSLSIKNFLLINDLTLDFKQGFTAITGETGAGKSILLEALALLLGKRATENIFQNAENKCIIEAEFDLTEHGFLQEVFTQLDLDFSPLTIVRREISPNGRTRLFINDSPSTLQLAQQLAPYLIDIHSQDANSILVDERFWYRTLDVVAQTQHMLEDYSKTYKTYFALTNQIDTLSKSKENLSKEVDFKSFQYKELLDAELKHPEELTQLESELTELSNSEFIVESLDKIRHIAESEQVGIKHQLYEIAHSLNSLSDKVESYKELKLQFEPIQIEFNEWLNTLPESESNDDYKERLDIVNHRLSTLYNLLDKHHLSDLQDLINYRDTLQSELDLVSGDDGQLEHLISQRKELESSLNSIASQLKDKREQASVLLLSKLKEDLQYLAMKEAEIKIKFEPLNAFNKFGKHQLSILVRTNLGSSYGEMSKITSGGEKSRLIFALKHILSDYKMLPTIIFDEVDTGISGKVSEHMGKMMSHIGLKTQILSITHSPQIAATASQHYKVSKSVQADKTITDIHLLTANERINEIASMVSGEDFSEHALNHARELLNL